MKNSFTRTLAALTVSTAVLLSGCQSCVGTRLYPQDMPSYGGRQGCYQPSPCYQQPVDPCMNGNGYYGGQQLYAPTQTAPAQGLRPTPMETNPAPAPQSQGPVQIRPSARTA